MKPIDELHGKHAGDDIWIIGAGASIQYLDPAFFDGKVTIGINRAGRRIPTTYTILKDGEPTASEAMTYPGKVIVSEFRWADHESEKNTVGHYFFEHPPRSNPDNVDLSPIGTAKILTTWSTLSSAMHLACEIGAANIILCGIDGGTIDGEFTFAGYYDEPVPPYFYKHFVRDVLKATRTVRDALQNHYGCRIYSLNPFVGMTTDHHAFECAESIPRCRHCDSGKMSLFCENNRARFFTCAACACVSSDLSYADVLPFYQQADYATHHNVPREKLLESVRHNWRRILETETPEKSVLDVGCLEGALLELLDNEGWQTQGWDIEATGRPEGTKTGAEFHAADMGQQFGVVISREVIEHVPNHRAHLRELAAAVMPGGFLHLQAPRPHDDKTDNIVWQTTHLQIIDPASMRQLLIECGLIPEYSEFWTQGQLWQARKPA